MGTLVEIGKYLLFYGQKSCYKQEVQPVGFRMALRSSVNRLRKGLYAGFSMTWFDRSVLFWTSKQLHNHGQLA